MTTTIDALCQGAARVFAQAGQKGARSPSAGVASWSIMLRTAFPAFINGVLATARRFGGALRRDADDLVNTARRGLSAIRPRGSPESREVLPAWRPRRDHAPMGKADLEAVLERRAEIARELVAIEQMRGDIASEDGELEVAERVLRRLAETLPALGRRGEPPARLAAVTQSEPAAES